MIKKFLIDLVLYSSSFTVILFFGVFFFSFLLWDINLIRKIDHSLYIRVAIIMSIPFSLFCPIVRIETKEYGKSKN